MVSALDIGETAADLMTASSPEQIVKLTGPADPSAEDVAAGFAELLGRPVRVLRPPLEDAQTQHQAAGMTETPAGLYTEMFKAMTAGRVVSEGVPRRGRIPLDTTLSRRCLLAVCWFASDRLAEVGHNRSRVKSAERPIDAERVRH